MGTSSDQRSRMQLNIKHPRCSRWSLATKNYPAPNVSGLKLSNVVLEAYRVILYYGSY